MMEMVGEDFITTRFGITWSRATNKMADTSAERACQWKWWPKRRETKRNFLDQFSLPRFASGYDQNHKILSDVSHKIEHREALKLMITEPKWGKRNNQRKLIGHFTKYWILLTGWIIIRPKIGLTVPQRNQENHKRKERPWTLPKESELNCRAVGTLLKAVCCISST